MSKNFHIKRDSSTEEVNKGKILMNQIDASIAELEKKIESPETEEQIRQWLSFHSRFHNYSPLNTFSLYIQTVLRGIPAERFASFKDWSAIKNDKGEKVCIKKGEKGLSILFPRIGKIYQKDTDRNYILDSNGKKIPELDQDGNEKTWRTFGVGYVFDINQTNAKEIGAYKELDHRGKTVLIDPELPRTLAKQITEVYQIPVSFVEDKSQDAGGWFIPSERTITINTAVVKEPSQQLGTIFHELGHALLHGDNGEMYSGELKEGQAEAFAYASSLPFGIERKSELYIKHWISDEVPLSDVIQNLGSHVRDAFKKLGLDELIEKQHLPVDRQKTEGFPAEEARRSTNPASSPLQSDKNNLLTAGQKGKFGILINHGLSKALTKHELDTMTREEGDAKLRPYEQFLFEQEQKNKKISIAQCPEVRMRQQSFDF